MEELRIELESRKLDRDIARVKRQIMAIEYIDRWSRKDRDDFDRLCYRLKKLTGLKSINKLEEGAK